MYLSSDDMVKTFLQLPLPAGVEPHHGRLGMAVQKSLENLPLPQPPPPPPAPHPPTPPAAVHNTSQEQDGDVYSCSFQEEKVSALQVVDAKVRLGRISARIDCSLTCLAGLGQEKARLASLKLPSLGMPSGVLCLTLLPPDWVVARMPQVSSWITYSLCLSHY